MTKVQWHQYDGRFATATARAYVNDCIPFCAAGHLYRPKAHLRLSRIRRGGHQNEMLFYALLRYRLYGSLPSGFPRHGVISLRPTVR